MEYQAGLLNYTDDSQYEDTGNEMFGELKAIVVDVYPEEYAVDVSLPNGNVLTKVPVRAFGGVYNGKFNGEFNLPRPNDEVTLFFINGYSESPVVSGGFIFPEEPSEKTKAFLSDKAINDYVVQRGDIEFKIKGDESELTIKKLDNSLLIKVDLTGNKIVIDGGSIEIGTGTLEKLLKSETFKTLYNQNVSKYNAHTHPGGGAPNQAMTNMSDSELSTKIKTV